MLVKLVALFSAWDRFFLAATNGWAWCNHNAEVVERVAALRNLLLVGSLWLEFPKGVAGMDSLNKHVEQISFRQSHFANIGSWKAGSSTKGWAWCNQNAECTVALRNLLLVGSLWLEFPKGVKGMDALNKHVEQISFRQSHFANIGSWKAGSPTSNPLLLKAQSRQLKGWQPNFHPLLLKAQSRQLFIGLQESHSTVESTISLLQQILETTNPWPNPLLLCMRQAFTIFSCSCNKGMAMMQLQCLGGGACCRSQEPASGREWMIGIPKRSCRNGFLRQTCRTNPFWAVNHIFGTWAAERLAATLPTHCC